MNEFNISDKELKSLLQSEGLEQPSTNLNQSILSKIEVQEKEKIKPAKAPKWVLLLTAFVFITPTIYFIFFGDSSALENRSVNIPVLNMGVSTKSILILTFATLAIGMALIFSRMLKQQSTDKARVKKG